MIITTKQPVNIGEGTATLSFNFSVQEWARGIVFLILSNQQRLRIGVTPDEPMRYITRTNVPTDRITVSGFSGEPTTATALPPPNQDQVLFTLKRTAQFSEVPDDDSRVPMLYYAFLKITNTTPPRPYNYPQLLSLLTNDANIITAYVFSPHIITRDLAFTNVRFARERIAKKAITSKQHITTTSPDKILSFSVALKNEQDDQLAKDLASLDDLESFYVFPGGDNLSLLAGDIEYRRFGFNRKMTIKKWTGWTGYQGIETQGATGKMDFVETI